MRSLRSLSLPLTMIGLLLAAGCTDEETVFVDKPLFEDPPEASAGFMGYDEEGQKLTVCGNCHVGQQSGWDETAHADAWDGLQASGHSQEFCEGCHTTGPAGNLAKGDVGHNGTQSSRYHDVQCESCHGAGLAHVTNPDASQPLASIKAHPDLNTGCGECHQGAHHDMVNEWVQSGHAEPTSRVVDRAVADPGHYGACMDCHSGQGALAAWGVNAEYVEKDAGFADHDGITCAVCHDPHENTFAGQLRFPIDVPSEDQNLCVKCHHKRAQPELEADVVRGPHSPEGPLLFGDAGWFPPGFEPPTGTEDIRGTHGGDANPALCATCHVHQYDVNDQETGEFIVSVTGHTFEAIPCVDSNGLPTGEDDCDLADRNFGGCTGSGCHGDEVAARNAMITADADIADLIAQVEGLLSQVPDGELDNADGVFTVADGADFNVQLAEHPGTSVHNPFLAKALLRASRDALIDTYDLPGLRADGQTSSDRNQLDD